VYDDHSPAPRAAPQAPALPSGSLADIVRAKLLADLGQVQTGRTGQQRTYTPRAELLARAVAPETFGMVLDWVSSARRASVHTRRAYVDDIRAWAAFADEVGAGPFRVGCLTRDQVRVWRIAQEARTPPPAKSTLRRRLSALSSLHAYAAGRTEGLPPNPVTEDDVPKVPRGHSSRSTPVLEKEHITALAEHARDDRERLVVVLLYVLAGRVGEMCAARIGAMTTTATGVLALDLTRKEDKKRLLVLPPVAADLLRRHTEGRAEGPLLLDAAGGPLDRYDVKRLVGRLGRHAGVLPGRAVTPHVLRASRLTHMLDDRVPLAEVQAYADHDDPATTVGYRERRLAAQRNERLAAGGARLFARLSPPPSGPDSPTPPHS
jgi:site-specific recombinase XerD